MRKFFEGYYYKHQKNGQTLSLIVGYSGSERFIQVITGDFSEKFPFTSGNYFSEKGVVLNLKSERITLSGKIRYENLSPIKYDIMGPFRFFPMECRHGIVSMRHLLRGKITLNGEVIDFTDGIGYIEKDSGCSFPSSYMWVQANDFPAECSVMAAVAVIPFCGLHFRGCICVVQYGGKEYRLATYLGVRVLVQSRKILVLKQGKYRLEIRIKDCSTYALSAPQNGEMTRVIRESVSCPAEFIFSIREKTLFHLFSENAGYEYDIGEAGKGHKD